MRKTSKMTPSVYRSAMWQFVATTVAKGVVASVEHQRLAMQGCAIAALQSPILVRRDAMILQAKSNVRLKVRRYLDRTGVTRVFQNPTLITTMAL